MSDSNHTLDISQIRSDIDRVDSEILRLLAERRAHSLRIAREKGRADSPSRDQIGEEHLIAERIAAGLDHDLDSGLIIRLWREIVNDSVRVQQETLGRGSQEAEQITAAIQGIEGSYSHLASEQYHQAKGIDVTYVKSETFADAVGVCGSDGEAPHVVYVPYSKIATVENFSRAIDEA